MFSKKAIVVSTAAGNGAKTAVKDIKDALFYWGIPYILPYGISIQAMNWKGIRDNKILKKKNVKAGFKTKAIFMLMRMMQKANMGAGDADRAYWEQMGWLEKGRPWK